MNLLNYLDEHFPGLTLSLPLFYKWPVGIRFELNSDVEKEIPLNDAYFAAVSKRANRIYKETFQATDYLFVVAAQRRVFDWSPEAAKFRSKARGRKPPDLFRLSRDLSLGLTRPAGKQTFVDLVDSTSREVVTLRWTEVTPNGFHCGDILTAAANQDFPTRRPQCIGETFFIDTTKHIILNMYDDRGMDVIAKSPNTLRDLYSALNPWILDHDRKKIEQVFS